MNPPENFYVLDQILKTEPRNLKWVFSRSADIQTKSHADILGTQRLALLARLAAHGADAEKGAESATATAKWYQKAQPALECAAQACSCILRFSESSSPTWGGRRISFRSQNSRSARSNRTLTWAEGRRLPARGSGDVPGARREFPAQARARRLPTARPEFIDPYAERPIAIAPRKIRQAGRGPDLCRRAEHFSIASSVPRIAAARPAALVQRLQDLSAVIRHEVRVDDEHLTDEGAAEFTRLLALEFVRSDPPALTSHAFR